jgi:tRNA-specific 2-thiouridylase
VFVSFLADLEQGRTPNPDVLCNRHVKFGAFLAQAHALGATHVATGHYARVLAPDLVRPHHVLACATDPLKDQTYE